jgi:hypothetical protein
VGVEPGELVGGRSSHSQPQDRRIRIQDLELAQQLLGLASRVVRREQGRACGQRRVTAATNSTMA